VLSLATLLLAQAAPPAPVSELAEPRFEERSCTDPALDEVARCGTVRVPEDRRIEGGRTIELNIVILPALGEADLPPQYDLEGGPGLAATRSAGFYLTAGSAYRARREVVLVDQRGTGGSNRLTCAGLEAPEAASQEMFPLELVDQCLAEVTAHADPALYGTSAAVEDLDAVRAALKHERIDLFALSYGTTMALRYMATHPQRVRAAVLMGTAPPWAMPPQYHAPAAERALELLFGQCAADEACRAVIPDAAGDLDRALQRLHAGGGQSPEQFMERIRSLLYQPSTARSVPWIVHRAESGDFAPFEAATRPSGPSPFADGQFLSITCGESFALMDYEAAAIAARATRFGDYRLRRQRQACERWPGATAAADHLAPFSSDTAVLFLSGELDPVTPPEWADRLAAQLPRSLHLVLPGSGHIFDGMSGIDTCLDPLLVRFLETADFASLDPGCIAGMQPPPFVVSDAG